MLESLSNKVAGLKAAPTQVFSCEICKIFKNAYFEAHLPTTASGIINTSLKNVKFLTLSCIMLKNGQTYFKNWEVFF